MFDAQQTIADAFMTHLRRAFHEAFPEASLEQHAALERAARTALETLGNCDCAYHDLEHTVLVTDAGLSILRGRQMRLGDLEPDEWLHAVAGMLFHDIGYIRGLLREDHDGSYITDAMGHRVTTHATATDAALTPYHVARGCLYVRERFAGDPVLDGSRIAEHVAMTQFPVPSAPRFQDSGSLSALVRAADLIGQMADPAYPIKQARLFTEFQETGEANRLGLDSAADLRARFPTFFYAQVYPYITTALDYLSLTRDGRQWSANLYRHVHRDAGTLPERVSPWSGVAALTTQRAPTHTPNTPELPFEGSSGRLY